MRPTSRLLSSPVNSVLRDNLVVKKTGARATRKNFCTAGLLLRLLTDFSDFVESIRCETCERLRRLPSLEGAFAAGNLICGLLMQLFVFWSRRLVC